MMTRSAGWATAAPRGGRMGVRTCKGGGRTRGRPVDQGCDSSTFKSIDEEYAMAVRDFKKFFKRRDAAIQIILLESILNHQNTRTKECSSEVIGVIAVKKNRRRSKTRHVPYLKHQMRYALNPLTLICLGVDLEPDEWIKDSGCSKHMTGNQKLFSSYKAYNEGNVIFGSNLRGNIIGKGQICDNKCRVTFSEHDSEITKMVRSQVKVLGRKAYMRLGHANMRLIQSLASKELVRNLPKLKFDQHFYDACKIGKQAHASHKAKNIVSMTRYLELLHMDLFGLSAVRSYGGNRYTLVIVDDYSRYTWTRFLKDKTEAFDQFEIFSKKIQNQLECTIVSIRTDHSMEFDNEVQFGEFCNANGITHNFFAPRTPQSNGVVERKNRTLQEMSRTMLNEQSLPQKFWCNAIDTSTYILNRILIRAILGKTPYELLRVARLESIRILLAYACALDFKLFQMDVKSAFLNGFINEEVYVAQPPGFIDFEKLDHVYKLKKALYGLKQAPKAWYDRLKAFLIKHEYKMGMFEMSMMGELNFFLGLQIKQMDDGIFFNQSKYIKEMLKKFGLEESKPMKTPMSSDTKLTKDEECESVDSTKYRGMIEQTALAISTTKAEYISVKKACQQALWMKQALIDYDIRIDDVPIMYDNKGAIDLSKKPGAKLSY
ncbi:retrovirus-related pol polyprotein from transposon TNT 1-94 [Tanacetum coccineum]|uniref:Retrovirus-related pol polyprotein from transposon TNT 1-94 n=1 Tax=Tanacetum coccineum TaxID=301880 RepID=A0ABQ5A777_9ASTR